VGWLEVVENSRNLVKLQLYARKAFDVEQTNKKKIKQNETKLSGINEKVRWA
jgi:hypothetical protein